MRNPQPPEKNQSDSEEPKARPTINVLWFKRDLRLRDHAPLKKAIEDSQSTGRPLLLFYCFEPSVVAHPNYDLRHWRFVHECLSELNRQLAEIGASDSLIQSDENDTGQKVVWIFHREVVDVLQAFQNRFVINTLYSHQETGLKITYDRDKAVSKFCRDNEINWQEFPTGDVIRPLKNRETWTADWKNTMLAPQIHPDLTKWNPVAVSDRWFEAERGANLPAEWTVRNPVFQPGGETKAHRYLESFFGERITDYHEFISKPLESRSSCSRLSPYIAWGCLSTRQAYQAQKNCTKKGIGRALATFNSRLRARSWFMQAFENEEQMEFQYSSRLSGTVERNKNPEHYAAWRDGHTGYPLVDASMRCLIATGYINFRMRCLLVSFLAHLLLQQWNEGACHLARLFTDFEPGIHYGQIQMQSGASGMNTIRIYNPIKQSQEHDPEGIFIKMWIPELANCPVEYIHQPWTMPPLEQEISKIKIGTDYPAPIVEYLEAFREARQKLNQPRQTEAGQDERARIKKNRPSVAAVQPKRSSKKAKKTI